MKEKTASTPENSYIKSPKRIRVFFSGQCIADSKTALLVWGVKPYPIYFFPKEDLNMEYISPDDTDTRKGEKRQLWTVTVGDEEARKAAISYPGQAELEHYLTFKWEKMEAWFEEDEEVFVHPRDPFKRIDKMASSRTVQAELNGKLIAKSSRPVMVFETGLPTRYYLPKVDLQMDLLIPSKTQTRCPYKGNASYYHIEVNGQLFKDIAWYYPFPTPNLSKIRGMVCLYHEKLDKFLVDGEAV